MYHPVVKTTAEQSRDMNQTELGALEKALVVYVGIVVVAPLALALLVCNAIRGIARIGR